MAGENLWVEPLECRLMYSATSFAPRRPTMLPEVPTIVHSQSDSSSLQKQYLRVIRAIQHKYHVPGLVVGISGADGQTWETAQGLGDVADKTPISTNEEFAIRSVTKSFTVTLILQLARAGELSLTDPIGKYVPGIPNGDQITLTQLAAMESGIKSYTQVQAFLNEFVPNLQQQWTPQELVDFGISLSPVFAPGAKYDYSNTNTVLLGMVAEQVTHLPLAQALQQFIFTPLGLNNTYYLDGLTFPGPHPTGYEINPQTKAADALPIVNFSAFGASGAMVSNIDDLLTWGRALGTGALIGPQLQKFRLDHSRPATDGPEYDRYGLGIGELKGWWGHTGDGLGFQAATFYDPKSGTTIGVLVNSSQHVHVATEVFKALADIVAKHARHGACKGVGTP